MALEKTRPVHLSIKGDVILGFTGTREGMTEEQMRKATNIVNDLVKQGVKEAHHGDCIGADEEFHDICMFFDIPVILHPPLNDKLRAYCQGAFLIEEPLAYLARNLVIVNACTLLLAAPKESQEPPPQRGQGTWSTVRYARKTKCLLRIVWP